MNKILDTFQICAPVISQFAALGCLEAGAQYCREKLEETKRVRKMAIEALSELGDKVEVPEARGAFYFLIRPRTNRTPMEIVEQLVSKYRIAVIPGTAFGVDEQCALRLSYGPLTTSTAREGITRLTEGLFHLLP
jgi:aspartate/methionine/tyrosine aminotransferase